MAITRKTEAFWSVIADQNVTRRKWYHILVNPHGNHEYHGRRLTEVLDAAEQEGQHDVLLKLPNGRIWSMRALGGSNKET